MDIFVYYLNQPKCINEEQSPREWILFFFRERKEIVTNRNTINTIKKIVTTYLADDLNKINLLSRDIHTYPRRDIRISVSKSDKPPANKGTSGPFQIRNTRARPRFP